MHRHSDEKRKRVLSWRMLMVHWPEGVIFAMACGLAVVWFGPGAALLVLPFGLLGFLLIADRRRLRRAKPVADAGDLGALQAAIDDTYQGTLRTEERFACILARMDAHDAMLEQADQSVADRARAACLDRVSRVIRHDDLRFDLSDGRFALLLRPGVGLDRAVLLSIAERLQTALADSGPQGQGDLRLSASLGVCTDDAPRDRSGRAMIAALEDAAAKAARDGPSAIRFHGEDVRT
jgi:GGDEF domain-containing protein